MSGLREAWLKAYRSFWLLPGLAIAAAAALGVLVPLIDEALTSDLALPLFAFEDADAARGLLETVAMVTVSVAGISFSVTVVALQLASQQLSPRVLRTFQEDRLSQATLGVFLGAAVYCLLVLAVFRVESGEVPKLATSLAILIALAAFALFVAFIHNIVRSLQAPTLIRRMAQDGRRAAAHPFPAGIAREPERSEPARRLVEELFERSELHRVRAPRAGYLVAIEGSRLIALAREGDGVIRQHVEIGEFVLTGQTLAELAVTGEEADVSDEWLGRLAGVFEQSEQRTVDQDYAFPVRQLADVALRGLSPSLNDPTTTENALGSLADTLVVFAHAERTSMIRCDEEGEPRLVARAPDLDDLVNLGFDQVRQQIGDKPVLASRVVELLDRVRRAAEHAGSTCAETTRQIELIGEGIDSTVTDADAEKIREAVAAATGPDGRNG